MYSPTLFHFKSVWGLLGVPAFNAKINGIGVGIAGPGSIRLSIAFPSY